MSYDCCTTYKSPIGDIILFSKNEYLTGLYFLDTISFDYQISNNVSDVLRQTIRWLDIYFDGKIPDMEIPLSLKGSDFRLKVWKIISEIEYGKTVSYKMIAERIAKEKNIERMSNQAIGTAVSKNPISIVIPCHRVINANGNIGNYAGGNYRKDYLLNLENKKKG